MSPKDNTAISVVPPPISITIFPVGLLISRPAPIAATFGSSSINTFLAPHLSATSLIADFSIDVIFDGQQIKIVGLAKIPFKFNLLIKWVNKISVILKSAITPSFNGLIAWTLPGVLPNISFASCPTANGFLVSSSIDTTEGSFTTIPSPLT